MRNNLYQSHVMHKSDVAVLRGCLLLIFLFNARRKPSAHTAQNAAYELKPTGDVGTYLGD